MIKIEVNPKRIYVHADNEACIPKQAHYGEWFDCSILEDCDMKAGEFKILDLGFRAKVPEDYEAILAPRSSTFKKYGILMVNSIGVIDGTYCGENDKWGFPAYATRDVHIDAGTRICQFRIQENQGTPKIELIEKMEDEDRGGYGSTGD